MEFFVFNFQIFMLIFSRIMGVVFTAVFLKSESFPISVKLGFTFFLSIVIFPIAHEFIASPPGDTSLFLLSALGEGIIGASIGFAISVSFSVFQLAGQLFTVQMGFGASEVYDPASNISLPLMGQFLYLVFTLVFLNFYGPALIIKEVYHSFDIINFAKFTNGQFLYSPYGLLKIFSDIFVIGLKIAFPIAGTLFLVSITLGLLAKAAPQMNLLIIGFPISISVGFIILLILLPGIVEFIFDYIDHVFKNLWRLMLEVNHG